MNIINRKRSDREINENIINFNSTFKDQFRSINKELLLKVLHDIIDERKAILMKGYFKDWNTEDLMQVLELIDDKQNRKKK